MKKFSILLFVFLGIFIVFPLISLADGLVPCGSGTAKPACEFCDLFVLFKNIVDFLLVPCSLNNNIPLVSTIAFLMLVIAGAMYMLAYMEVIGNPNWISQAKSLIWSVVIGLIIIYGAWLIVNLFLLIIGINSAEFKGLPQDWFRINCP